MPMQSGTPGSGNFPGLSMVAWAVCVGGVIVKGSGFASCSNPAGSVNYMNAVLTSALPSTNYVVQAKCSGDAMTAYMPTTTQVSVTKIVQGVATNIGAAEAVFIAVYG